MSLAPGARKTEEQLDKLAAFLKERGVKGLPVFICKIDEPMENPDAVAK